MPFTQAQLDALKDAKAKGVLKVQYHDKIVTYRSIQEIDRIIADIEAELQAAAGETPIRQVRSTSRKGFV